MDKDGLTWTDSLYKHINLYCGYLQINLEPLVMLGWCDQDVPSLGVLGEESLVKFNVNESKC